MYNIQLVSKSSPITYLIVIVESQNNKKKKKKKRENQLFLEKMNRMYSLFLSNKICTLFLTMHVRNGIKRFITTIYEI